jgi:hypothetical protein
MDDLMLQHGLSVEQAAPSYADRLIGDNFPRTVQEQLAHDGLTRGGTAYRKAAQALSADGLTPEQVEQQYQTRRQQAVSDWVEKKNATPGLGESQPGDWIYSELLAEAGVRQLWGKNVVEVAAGLKGGRDVPVEHRPATIFGEKFESLLDDPAMGKLVRDVLTGEKNFRPGIDTPANQEAPLRPEEIGGKKVPETGQTFQDYFQKMKSGRNELKSAKEQRKGIRIRQQVMEQTFPTNVIPLPLNDTSDQMTLRQRSIGGVERRGRKLGDAFYQNPDISDSMKTTAAALEHGMGSDERFKAWYNETHKNGISSTEDLTAKIIHDFQPDEFFVDKHGHLLARGKDFGTLEDTLLPKLAERHGEYSLDPWGGNIQSALVDAKTYSRNLAAGRPGDTGIGARKRDILNLAMFGNNAGNQGPNPLRAGLHGRDSVGIIRSLRIDRLETLERSQAQYGKMPHTSGAQNLSPQLNTLKQFSPSVDPRGIKSAAVQHPDGRVWEDSMHFLANRKALQDGLKPLDLLNLKQGFTTNTPGEFLSREEAFKRADELGQLEPESPILGDHKKPMLTSEALQPNQFSPSAAKPEIAQLGTSEDKNNFGDPLGTQYHATPEDWAKWQDVQGRLKQVVASGNFDAYPPLGKENEAIKNRYGGNPPAAPLASPGQFSPSGKRQDYLGLVDDRAGVTGMWTPDAYKVDHSDLPGRGERWRYINSTKSVEWNEEPNRENLQRVEDWLERRDSPVAKHSVWADWSDGKAHLETLEPHPQQFSAKAEDRPEISEHPFYSQLAKTVEDKFSGSQMPAAQLAAILRNPQNGVKADEMKWTGLDDFLQGKGKVTKSEVQDFLKANQVQVKEVTKEEQPRLMEDLPEGGDWEGDQEEAEGGTKFENYQLPGGSNYKELLFQLPPKHDAGNVVPYEFTSGHWDEPNVVAHSRVNEREDTAGKPGLFIEEIQSDWHQKGRKEGYNTEEKLRDTSGWHVDRFMSPHRYGSGQTENINVKDNQNQMVRQYTGPMTDAEAIARAARESLASRQSEKVPDAPFKTTWHEMVFRRMVRMAAEKGKDWLGWTTGEQQAARYDLSKHVDSISWVRESGELRAFKGDNEVLHQNGVEDSDMLADYIGKEAAAKLATQPAQSNPIGKPVRWLEGEDLKIGGAGMKGFYDKILVDYANKFGKKFGTKVEDRSIPVSENKDKNLGLEYYAATNTYDVIDKESGAAVKTNLTEAEARKYLRIGGAREKVHSLPITPEMKKSVLEQGVALFSPKVDDGDWKLAKGGAGFSKAWITPEGQPVQLGATWHHQWLNDNPEIRRKYGIPRSVSDEGNRVSALKAGFVRLNYGINGGRLTIEARKKDWVDRQGGVAKFVKANASSLDWLTVILTDDNAKRVIDQQTQNVMSYSNREKLEHIPFITEPSEVVEMSPQASSAKGQFSPTANREKDVDKTAEPAETADVNKVANTEKLGGLTSIPMGKAPPPWEPATPEGTALKAAGLSVIRRGEPGSWSFYVFKPGETKDLGRVFTKDNHIVDAAGTSKPVLDALKAETMTQLSSDAKQRSANFSPKTDEPESVGRAAIRVGDKVFYGKDHNAAKVEAVRGGKGIPEIEEDGEYGFQTNQRPFVSREAGRRVAEAAGQTFKSQQTKPAPLTAEQIQAPGSVHYSPKAEAKPGILGTTDKDDNYRTWGTKVSNLAAEENNHPEKTGTVEDGTTFNWRYRPDTKTVYWWSRPSAELKEAAEAWLNKTGKNPVDHHVVIGGGGATGAYHTEAHGKGVPGQQFSPSEEPDAIWKPAGKDEKTGRIYTGWVHGDVLASAKKDGIKLPLSALGFVTRSGKFLDRQAAFRRAVEMGQIDSETWEGLPGRLDTVNFLDAQQFSPQAPTKQDYRYAKRIVAITEWKKGCTFNVATGKAAQAGKDPLYNVSIYPDPDRAVILPAGQKLTHERVAQFIADNRDLLKDPDNSVGTWINDEDGKTYLDISISTPDIKFAKFAGEKYNQKAIWDLKAMENIPTGGTGEAVKGLLPAQKRLAKLREEWAQEHGPVADENFKEPEEDETQGELAGATTPGFARAQDMTLPQIAEHFPESVKPETRGQQISYDILNAPLVRGMTRPQAVSAYTDKMVEEMKKWQDHPLFQSGLRWYSEFVPMLKRVYGKDADLMAQLLAATSPRSDPGVNWGFAEEALDLFKRGHFDKQLAKYEQGLKMGENGTLEKWYNARVKKGLVKNAPKTASSGTWLGEWVHANNLKPRQANGQLFGMRSGAVLEVLSGRWLETNKGLKVNQFLKNLMGTDHGATVDVWAARLMRRLGYEGLQERHRILPMNETAVSDSDFRLSQEVFAEAAKRMGITPDALQGGMWFAEKQNWHDKGWSPLNLGDYRKEIKKGGMIRQRVGIRLEERKTKEKAGPAPEQKSLL